MLYKSEGLAEVASVAYQDNSPCCRLMDAEYARHRFNGILSILNDVTSAPLNRNLTDVDFANEIKRVLWISVERKQRFQLHILTFSIRQRRREKRESEREEMVCPFGFITMLVLYVVHTQRERISLLKTHTHTHITITGKIRNDRILKQEQTSNTSTIREMFGRVEIVVCENVSLR